MADNAQTYFAKMGDYPLDGGLVNVSGQRSPYTTPVSNFASGDSDPDVGTRSYPGHIVMSGERSGPTFRPMQKICFPNAPEHSATGRGMRILPPATGIGDFWTDRSASQSGQVI